MASLLYRSWSGILTATYDHSIYESAVHTEAGCFPLRLGLRAGGGVQVQWGPWGNEVRPPWRPRGSSARKATGKTPTETCRHGPHPVLPEAGVNGLPGWSRQEAGLRESLQTHATLTSGLSPGAFSSRQEHPSHSPALLLSPLLRLCLSVLSLRPQEASLTLLPLAPLSPHTHRPL